MSEWDLDMHLPEGRKRRTIPGDNVITNFDSDSIFASCSFKFEPISHSDEMRVNTFSKSEFKRNQSLLVALVPLGLAMECSSLLTTVVLLERCVGPPLDGHSHLQS